MVTAKEGQFFLNRDNDELRKYYLVRAALPDSTVDLIADIMEGVLPADPPADG
jgi:hypothetical protein